MKNWKCTKEPGHIRTCFRPGGVPPGPAETTPVVPARLALTKGFLPPGELLRCGREPTKQGGTAKPEACASQVFIPDEYAAALTVRDLREGGEFRILATVCPASVEGFSAAYERLAVECRQRNESEGDAYTLYRVMSYGEALQRLPS